MPGNLPPPPVRDEGISTFLRDWLTQLYNSLGGTSGTVPWDNVSKSGSNLSELTTRLHSDLQNLSTDDHQQYVLASGTRNITGPQEFEDNIVLPKTSGKGIKVDTTTPTFGWRDLEGPITVPNTGVGKPTLTTYASPVEDYAFSVNDHYGPLKYHIPHDYVPGSDLYIHIHWSHDGTNISGSLVCDYFIIYAKGHNQASFPATPVQLTQTISSLNITNTPQRSHRIDEIQLSATSPSASQIDSDDIETDGLIIVHFDVPTIPTITGGAAKPFIHYVDIHYQSTNMATKNKAPNFHS